MNNSEVQEVKNLPELPVEMWTEVLKYLPNRRELSLVSKTFYEAVKSMSDNNIFASIHWSDFESSIEKVEEKVRNQSKLNIQLISPNLCILDFLKNHGDRVKVLKIENKCQLKDLVKILLLVPNCESLDIAAIKFVDNSYHDNEPINMMKLNDLNIHFCDDSNNGFWKFLNTPALNKLKIKFFMRNFRKVDEFLNQNQQIKILDMNEVKIKPFLPKYEFKNKKIVLNSLRNLTLDTLVIKNFSGSEGIGELCKVILEAQPDLKNLEANGGDSVFEAICTYASQLESLEMYKMSVNIKNLTKIATLTNLKSLTLRRFRWIDAGDDYFDPSPDLDSKFFEILKLKQLKYLNVDQDFFNQSKSLPTFLENCTELISLKVDEGFGLSIFDSIENLMSLNIENPNLKFFEIHETIPLRLFGKFILNYPNVVFLIITNFKVNTGLNNTEDEPDTETTKIESCQMMLDLIKKAKESTEGKEKVIMDLIEAVIETQDIFSAYDLFKLQLTLIQLGWLNLKALEITSNHNLENIEDLIEDFVNANRNLDIFSLRSHINFHNEKEFFEKFQGRFNDTGYENDYLLLAKINECDVKPKVIEIKNYSKCETILSTERLRSFKFDFGQEIAEKEKVFEHFINLLENFKGKIINLEAFGSLNGDQFSRLLSFIPNCEVLFLNELKVSSDLSHAISLSKVITLNIHKNLLKSLICPKLQTLKLSDSRSNNFIQDMIFQLHIRRNFIHNDEKKTKADNEEEKILESQTDLISLDVRYLSKEILKIISRNMTKLKKLFFYKVKNEFSLDFETEQCRSVEFLQCSDEKINIESFAKIFPNVKVMNRFDSHIHFRQFLETIKHFQNLETLTIRYRGDRFSMDPITEAPTVSYNISLTELTYDCLYYKSPVDLLISCLPNLQKLALCFTGATNENNQEFSNFHFEILLKKSNKIEYLYYDNPHDVLEIGTTEVEIIKRNQNLKFVYMERVKMTDIGKISNDLKTSFDIVKIDKVDELDESDEEYNDYLCFLLAKNQKTLQEVFKTNWNNAKIRANNLIRETLGLTRKKREEFFNDMDDSNSVSNYSITTENSDIDYDDYDEM